MFGSYTTPHTITEPISTNAFSYHERAQKINKKPQTTITPRAIGSREDVQLGDHVVIEEIDHTDTLQSHIGLRHNIYIPGPTPIAIMDNHNHALGIWRDAISATSSAAPLILHIDAHADLEPAQSPFPTDPIETQVRSYTHTQTHIGSFILPAQESGLIRDCIQIRSSYALEHLSTTIATIEPTTPIILDIDLDFRALEPTIPDHHLHILHEIMIHEPLVVTIATSPYFLDPTKGMRFLQQIQTICH